MNTKVETFAPTVNVDGQTVTPEGWMWILAYGLAGIPWALETIKDPTFDLKGKIEAYNAHQQELRNDEAIARLKRQLLTLGVDVDAEDNHKLVPAPLTESEQRSNEGADEYEDETG